MTDPDLRRRQLRQLLGDLPAPDRSIGVRKLGSFTHDDGYEVERLLLDLNGIEPVPAYFALPFRATGPLPALLYCHQHGGDYVTGKDELLVGRQSMQRPPYGKALTDAGYAVLAIDAWCFGERRGRSESETFKQMLWQGRVLWGMMVYDALRAVDYLATRPDVDADRIGVLGMSLGSTTAWWTAALHPRVAVCVDICCLTDFQALIETRNLDGHGIYYYVPDLLNHFTAAQINALIAPRPHLALAGIYDPLTPVAGLDRIDAELQRVYADAGIPDAWRLVRYGVGHVETAAMRADVLDWLARWL